MNFWVALGAGFFADEGLDMSGLDLADYVDNRFAREAVTDDPGQ